MSQVTYWIIDDFVCKQHNDFSDVVCEVRWRGRVRWISDDEDVMNQESFQSERFMTTKIDFNENNSFVDFSNLTEEIIWEWIDKMVDRSAIEEEMEKEIDDWRFPKITIKKPPF